MVWNGNEPMITLNCKFQHLYRILLSKCVNFQSEWNLAESAYNFALFSENITPPGKISATTVDAKNINSEMVFILSIWDHFKMRLLHHNISSKKCNYLTVRQRSSTVQFDIGPQWYLVIIVSILWIFTWVPQLLITPVKIRIFGPKTAKFCPKYAFLFILDQILPKISIFGHLGPNIGISGPVGLMADQITMRTRCLAAFSHLN